jgi:hypothetical protein
LNLAALDAGWRLGAEVTRCESGLAAQAPG